jgi:hypothetical protein
MGYPRFYLQSLEIPAVTQIRVSDDYGPSSRPDQWAIGDTAILAHAMGLAPFKDAFWSGFEQPGNPCACVGTPTWCLFAGPTH